MLTYFALFRFDPWAVLSRPQRRFVWRHCIHSMLRYLPVVFLKFLLQVAVIVPVALRFQGWQMVVGFFLVVFLLDDLIDAVVVIWQRRRIGQYINEHRVEIEAVVKGSASAC